VRFSTKMHRLHPPKLNEKCAIFDENAWTTDHENDDKCAIFDENPWTIAHQNDEKFAIFDENALTIDN